MFFYATMTWLDFLENYGVIPNILFSFKMLQATLNAFVQMHVICCIYKKTGKFLDISAESGACVQGCGYGGFRCSVTWVSFGVSPC